MEHPLVSIGVSVFNGERFILEALESLLAQEYPNIEILVLDNQSIDGTARICADLAERDPRLRLVIDDQRRDVMAGQKRAFELTKGEFFMVACDDDVYDPKYVSRLMAIMTSHSHVGVAYAAHAHVYPDGERRQIAVPAKFFFSERSAPARNFGVYLRYRFPVPLVFGIVRREFHAEALRYFVRVDENGWDHDNLYVLRLLSLGPAVGIPEVLFYYRQRDRSAYIPVIPGGWISHFYRKALHQVAVAREVRRIIAVGKFGALERIRLQVRNVWICLLYCTHKYFINTPFAARIKQPVAQWRASRRAHAQAG